MPLKTYSEDFVFPVLTHMGQLSGGPTAVTIDASTDWVGGCFYAAETGTIDRIVFRTSTVTSPVLTLVAAITQVDASYYPLGTDISVSSGVVNPAANTAYSETVSASVTKGTMYGIIVRVSSYTSGSATIRQTNGAGHFWNAALQVPFPSSRITASPAATTGGLAMGVRYNVDGVTKWTFTPGLMGAWINSTKATASNHTNRIVGTKYTFDRPVTVSGYMTQQNTGGAWTALMCAGADGTAISGSTVNYTVAYRQWAGHNPGFLMLPSPITLQPGTYRLGIRADANTIVTLAAMTFGVAGDQAHVFGNPDTVGTYWNGTTWADETIVVPMIVPLFGSEPDGNPAPMLMLP